MPLLVEYQDLLCTATPTHRKDISMIVNETSSKIVSPAKIESFILNTYCVDTYLYKHDNKIDLKDSKTCV